MGFLKQLLLGAEWKTVFEKTTMGIVMVESDGCIIAANDAACRIFGVEREALEGKSYLDIFRDAVKRDGSPFPKREFPCYLALTTGESVPRVLVGLRDPVLGERRWLAVRSVPVFKEGEQLPYRAICTVADVTDIVLLEESELRYRSLFEKNLSVMLLVHPKTGRILDANPAACSYYGYSHSQLTQLNICDINRMPIDQVKAEMVKARTESIKVFFFNHRLASGEVREVQVYSGPVEFGGETVLHSIIHDITDFRNAQAELELRNRELTLMNRLIDIGGSDATTDEVLAVACTEIQRAMGSDRVGVYLMTKRTGNLKVRAFHRREGVAPLSPEMHDIVLDSETISRLKEENIWMIRNLHETSIVPQELAHELVRSGVMSLTVISLKKKNELIGCFILASGQNTKFTVRQLAFLRKVGDQISASLCRRFMDEDQHLLKAAMEQTTEAVVITDVDGNINYVNPAFSRMTGYSSEEVSGRNPRILQSGKHNREFYEDLWAKIISGEVWKGRLRNKRKNGEEYVEDALIAPVTDNRRITTHFLGLKRDITDELERESRLKEAQKLESIGRLAGGIAHDFNNHLATILTGAALVQNRLNPADPAFEDLTAIRETVHHAGNLVRQLLTFASRQSSEPEPTDLNSLIMDLRDVLRRLVGAEIELVILPDQHLPPINIDRVQVEQILFNLVANARDAMPDGGKLTISTLFVENHEGDLTCRRFFKDIPNGRCVVLTVEDTGHGMSDEVKEKVFEPFFTTKKFGHGTGLGLATVFGIVRQSEGEIFVDSTPGEGSTFTVAFVAGETDHIKRDADSSDIQQQPHRGKVLLVDDEHSFRRFTMRILLDMGFTGEAAQDGHEAIRIWDREKLEGKRDFDILISDVFMPHMSGYELADELLKRKPDLCVLFVSGYAEPTKKAISDVGKYTKHISKPFVPAELVKKMSELLDLNNKKD